MSDEIETTVYSDKKNRSIVQVYPVDIENNVELGEERRPRFWTRTWRATLPYQEIYLKPALLTLVFCLAAVCVFQSTWIHFLRIQTIYRIPTDAFDLLFPSSIDRTSPSIWDNEHQSFLHDAVPVPVHSHNDYWRRIPLFEALSSGCISVEADVHLNGSDLLVGHTAADLRPELTLRAMYLEPLQRMLEAQNANITNSTWRGIFNLAPQQTLVLLIDHKTLGSPTFAELYTQLQPLRDLDYLTYWNGTDRVIRPITVIATGNAPFGSITALNSTHRDIFYDAKLDRLTDADNATAQNDKRDTDNTTTDILSYTYNPSNSWYASTNFNHAIHGGRGHKGAPAPATFKPLSQAQEGMLATQIAAAQARGLKARYWGAPALPVGYRDYVWDVLVEADVGILNADDMSAVRAKGWGRMSL